MNKEELPKADVTIEYDPSLGWKLATFLSLGALFGLLVWTILVLGGLYE